MDNFHLFIELIQNTLAQSLMLRSHQVKVKSKCDISSIKTVNLYRAIHTK